MPGATTLSELATTSERLVSGAAEIREAQGAPWLAVRIDHRFQRRGTGFHLHVSFTAHMQRTVVFGPSGSGKSSLLRVIAGLLRPDVGNIQLHQALVCQTVRGGQPRVFLAAEKRRVGLVMQNPAVFPHLTAARNVAFALRRLDKPAQKEKIRDLLQLVEGETLAERWPRELSGGQLQRIAIARTLAADPAILLLDEPFAALDAESRQRISENLHRWAKERGVPVLTVTHDLEEAFAGGEEVIAMEEGRVIAQGAPGTVLSEQRERLLKTLHATATGTVSDDSSTR